MRGDLSGSVRRPAEPDRPVPASRGWGPLVQRDYWAVLAGDRLRPSEVITLVRKHFRHLAPPDLIRFRGTREAPLTPGDDLRVDIRFAGTCRVRVVHVTPTSLTLATMPGHPEAGRITFGAYRNGRGDVVVHIRSRARSSSLGRRLGFLVGGDPMQSGTWTAFIDRIAAAAGQRILGAIQAESRVVKDEPEDRDRPAAPTFIARGD
jgi:hypothetical protein